MKALAVEPSKKMERKAAWRAAASSLMIAMTMAGCASGQMQSSGVRTEKGGEKAVASAAITRKALAAHNVALAVRSAEAAVTADTLNPEYRALLGRAYLMGGRYDSARTAFEDAIALGNREPRTIVSLSLIHTAQGRAQMARDLLYSHLEALPAADYGLAMAMAGDTDEAIRVLGQAIHDPAAGVKERQNLAYSYALAGRWQEARLMAAQDLGPAEAAARVLNWANLARPGAESVRVIAMIGVGPDAADAGMPVALALGDAPSPNLQTKVVDVAAAPSFLPQQEGDVPPALSETPAMASAEPAAVAAAPVSNADYIAAVQAPATNARQATPVLRASILPVRESVAAVVPSAKARTTRATQVRTAALVSPKAVVSGRSWMVQIGAFGSPDMARTGWTSVARRNSLLGGYSPVASEYVLNGRKFYRVAVGGFADRGAANSLCAKVKSQGGSCFVRQGGGEAAPQWAAAWAARPVKIALK